MRILVFEAIHSGHHFNYLQLLLPALLELTDHVTVVTGRYALDTDEYRNHLAPFADRVQIDAWLPSRGSKALTDKLTHNAAPRDEWSHSFPEAKRPQGPLSSIFLLRESIRRTRPDHVYLPYADGLAQMLGVARTLGMPTIPRGVEAEGLLMRGSFAYPQTTVVGRLKAAASRFAAARGPWRVLHYLDPMVYEKLKRDDKRWLQRHRLMPDPVAAPPPLERAAARRQLGIPEDGRYVGSMGMLDTRKGVHLLIRAFAESGLEPTDRLLFLGRLSATLRSMLEDEFAPLVRNGRIIALDRYVSDEELQAGIAAMDLVCTPYPRHIGSASIVIRAAAASRPVLASDFGWMGMVVPRFGLGHVCNVQDRVAFAAALRSGLDEVAGFRLTPAGERFVAFHSVANFQAAWTARLRERLGLSAAPMLTWDGVLEAA